MRLALTSAIVVLVSFCAVAGAEPALVNGDFEAWGASYGSGLYELTGWTNLSGLNIQASGAPAVFEHTPSTSNYLRLVDDQGQIYSQNTGHIVQDLGVMSAGEFYTFTADAFNTNQAVSSTAPYQVRASFTTAATIAAPALAWDTVSISPWGGTGAFSLNYAAAASDVGQHFYLRLDAVPVAPGYCTRGGIDNAQLLVTAGGKIHVAGQNNIGQRDEAGTHGEIEYVYRQGAPITINGISTGVVYAGTQDTYVHDGDSDTTTHGAETGMTIDPSCTSQNKDQGQALIRFDGVFGTGTGQLPAGTPIHRAYIELVQTDGIGYGPFQAYARRLMGPWDQATVNWNNLKLNGNTQAGLQVDGVEAKSGDAAWILPAGAPNATFRYALDLTGEIQYFVNHPGENYGWGIPPTAPWDNRGMDIVASESATEADRPGLRVYADTDTSMTSLAGGFTYVWELTDLLAYDQLRAYEYGTVGEAILNLNGAALEVDMFGEAVPQPGAYRLLLADTLVGSFSQIILPDIPGVTWDISGLAAGGDGYLRVIPEPASAALLLAGAASLLAHTRRRRALS